MEEACSNRSIQNQANVFVLSVPQPEFWLATKFPSPSLPNRAVSVDCQGSGEQAASQAWTGLAACNRMGYSLRARKNMGVSIVGVEIAHKIMIQERGDRGIEFDR
jgi:hypothetical protein